MIIQKCLSDESKGMRGVTLLSWATAYEVQKTDGALTPGACKRYLEDLLGAARHALERRRNESTGSTGSTSQKTTPKQREKLSSVDEDDIRYEK
jgi:hypothetical protein